MAEKRKGFFKKLKKEDKKLLNVILRYLFLIIVALPNAFIFYYIFGPLTTYPVYWILEIFYEPSVSYLVNFEELFVKGVIVIKNHTLEIIGACIAGTAYYLLLALNLTVPEIDFKRRLKMIGFSFGVLLFINIIRIFLLSLMVLTGSDYFDITHKIVWYGLSSIFVVGIWFLEVYIFKIKKIPLYHDFLFVYNKSIKRLIKNKKNSKK